MTSPAAALRTLAARSSRPSSGGECAHDRSDNVNGKALDLIGRTVEESTDPTFNCWTPRLGRRRRPLEERRGTHREGVRKALESLQTWDPATPLHAADGSTLPDHSLFAVALDDSFALGVLSSRPHLAWARAAGSRLGVGNDLRWRNATCFDPFPFPDCSGALTGSIRDLAEQLDAYGWPHDLTGEQILERLVALNKERAAEEKRGLVRWLRPEFQNASSTSTSTAAPMTQVELRDAEDDDEGEPATEEPTARGSLPAWPKKLAEQIGAVRELVTKSSSAWSAAAVTASFKGAKVDVASDVLDSLAALGLLVAYGAPDGRRWRAVGSASGRSPAM